MSAFSSLASVWTVNNWTSAVLKRLYCGSEVAKYTIQIPYIPFYFDKKITLIEVELGIFSLARKIGKNDVVHTLVNLYKQTTKTNTSRPLSIPLKFNEDLSLRGIDS